jgi:hypothetical protein
VTEQSTGLLNPNTHLHESYPCNQHQAQQRQSMVKIMQPSWATPCRQLLEGMDLMWQLQHGITRMAQLCAAISAAWMKNWGIEDSSKLERSKPG